MTREEGGTTKACVILRATELTKLHFSHLVISHIKIKGLK